MTQFKTLIALTLLRLLGSLTLNQARWLGALVGRINYRLNTRMARVTRRNLARCLPELDQNQREDLVRRSLMETGKVALEICILWQDRRTPIAARIVATRNEALVTGALAAGQGVIVMSPHLGNWEVLGLNLPSLGDVVSLYQPPKLTELEAAVRSSREMSGGKLVPTNAKGVAALLKSLKNGGISGILPDQNPTEPRSGEFAPFFGHPAFTMTLVHKLITKTRARVVFAAAKRVPAGFEVIYREPPEEIYSDDELRSLTALNRGVENLIREMPEQYQWEYKRFKKRPEGTGDFYHQLR